MFLSIDDDDVDVYRLNLYVFKATIVQWNVYIIKHYKCIFWEWKTRRISFDLSIDGLIQYSTMKSTETNRADYVVVFGRTLLWFMSL